MYAFDVGDDRACKLLKRRDGCRVFWVLELHLCPYGHLGTVRDGVFLFVLDKRAFVWVADIGITVHVHISASRLRIVAKRNEIRVFKREIVDVLIYLVRRGILARTVFDDSTLTCNIVRTTQLYDVILCPWYVTTSLMALVCHGDTAFVHPRKRCWLTVCEIVCKVNPELAVLGKPTAIVCNVRTYDKTPVVVHLQRCVASVCDVTIRLVADNEIVSNLVAVVVLATEIASVPYDGKACRNDLFLVVDVFLAVCSVFVNGDELVLRGIPSHIVHTDALCTRWRRNTVSTAVHILAYLNGVEIRFHSDI